MERENGEDMANVLANANARAMRTIKKVARILQVRVDAAEVNVIVVSIQDVQVCKCLKTIDQERGILLNATTIQVRLD